MRPREAFSRFSEKADENWFTKLKLKNPKLWKKLKKQFDVGRQIVQLQLVNGLERPNERVLRMYLHDYGRRFLKYGPHSFPTSFNVLEPFFSFNQHNSILQLAEEEESYGVSLFDFLDFVTEAEFDLDSIDLYNNIPNRTIYHFTFTPGFETISFSNSTGSDFIIGSLSIVRQGNEVSILMQAGQSYDQKASEAYFENRTRESVENSISSYKKSLGLELNGTGEPEVVPFEGREDLWLHSIAVLFDIESKSLDIRYVARDENINYSIVTDDIASMLTGDSLSSNSDFEKFFEGQLDQLSKYDAVFDFAKYCLALPYYVFENENKLVDVNYETSLTSVLDGPATKRKFKSVPPQYKVYAKPVYYLESSELTVIERKELDESSFNIEKSGYWRRIGIDEEGFDKKGRSIIGKTWVERNDTYSSSPKGVTSAVQKEVYEGENAGYVYVMREPTHEENIFKVGLTRRTPEIRSKELSNTSSVDKFFIVNRYSTKDCVLAEKEIHERLKEFRLNERREFFRCDLKLILEICSTVTDRINK